MELEDAGAPQRLRVFVYGTLKRNQRNHDRFCRGALRVEPATARGRLYELPFGFPGLHVHRESVLAVGTNDYHADVDRQASVTDTLTPPDPERGIVHGEVMTFEDVERRLIALDALEGYTPGSRSLYERVLIPVRTEAGILAAWTYRIVRRAGAHLPGGRWPA